MPSRPLIRGCRAHAPSEPSGWAAVTSRVAAIGLADIVVAAPAPVTAGGLLVDVDAVRAGLAGVATAARAAKLRLWLSLRMDAVDPRGPSAAAFRAPDWQIVDPRMPELAATTDFDSPAALTWWAERATAWVKAGVAGLIVDHADGVPPQFVTALTDAVPGLFVVPHLSGLRAAAGWRGGAGVLLDAAGFDLSRDGTWVRLAEVNEATRLILSTDGDPALAAALGDGWIAELPGESDDAAIAALTAAARTQPGSTPAVPKAGPRVAFTRRQGSLVVTTEIGTDGRVTSTAAAELPPILRDRPKEAVSAATAAGSGRIGIEAVTPTIEGGRFAAKTTLGNAISVEADLICDGHDTLGAVLQWRPANEAPWRGVRMRHLGNDRWTASFTPEAIGRYQFRVFVWRDAFATYQNELTKKVAAGLDVSLELREGAAMVDAVADRAKEAASILTRLGALKTQAEQAELLLSPAATTAMDRGDTRAFSTVSAVFPVEVDRVRAEFASWYELFPRSMSPEPGRHGTLRDVIPHLPRIAAMGFDILYFPPVHPIGRTNRKGRNNSLTPAADDPGSPYAIGSAEGGHDALHPELGTLADFEALRQAAEAHGMELAIDFAIQCSPDHPWLKEHPDWFDWRPDGTIRYAENPPKKYEDIVNVDFYAKGAVPDLWVALCDVVKLWAKRGVRVFRVDNPHTKPFPFWEWMIDEVRASYPDALFLAEAFTRPKIMARLGKVGFTQSYTYFTWRNTRAEMQTYLAELSEEPWRDCFRPNFFVNTPDINPPFLQNGGRPAHLIRAALATLLSGNWGMYAGFELCEATPVPGREEYLDSEKYQLRAWDWDRPGNISAEIARLNTVRRRNAALHTHLDTVFLPCDDPQVMVFERATPDRSNVLICAVSFDPYGTHTPNIELPLYKWLLPDSATLACEDVLHDTNFTLTGKWQRVTLTPDAPYTVWRAAPDV